MIQYVEKVKIKCNGWISFLNFLEFFVLKEVQKWPFSNILLCFSFPTRILDKFSNLIFQKLQPPTQLCYSSFSSYFDLLFILLSRARKRKVRIYRTYCKRDCLELVSIIFLHVESL